jgi:putative ABC transport system permease protein
VGGGSPALIGRRVTVLTQHESKAYTVSGVTRPVRFEHAIFFTAAEAARLSPRVDSLVPNGRAIQSLAGVQVLTGAARHQADPGAQRDSTDLTGLTSFLGIAAMLTGFVALYVTASAFGLSVAQRRRELALLRLTGATPGQVIRMVCTEAALVGLAGSATGCALGLVGGPRLAGWMARHGLAPAWFTVDPAAGSAGALAVAFAAGVGVAVLSVAVASARAAMIRPTEALREAAVEPRATGRGRRLAGAACLLAGSATLSGLLLAAATSAAVLAAVGAALGTAAAVPARPVTVVAVGGVLIALIAALLPTALMLRARPAAQGGRDHSAL